MLKTAERLSAKATEADKPTSLFYYKDISKYTTPPSMNKLGLIPAHILLDFWQQRHQYWILGLYALVLTKKFSQSLFEKKTEMHNPRINLDRIQSELPPSELKLIANI